MENAAAPRATDRGRRHGPECWPAERSRRGADRACLDLPLISGEPLSLALHRPRTLWDFCSQGLNACGLDYRTRRYIWRWHFRPVGVIGSWYAIEELDRNLTKVGVEGSNPFARSIFSQGAQRIGGLSGPLPANGLLVSRRWKGLATGLSHEGH